MGIKERFKPMRKGEVGSDIFVLALFSLTTLLSTGNFSQAEFVLPMMITAK